MLIYRIFFLIIQPSLNLKVLNKHAIRLSINVISQWEVMGSIIGQNHVVARDVKTCTYYYNVRFATLIVWVGGMPLPKTGATQYHPQLGLPHKGL